MLLINRICGLVFTLIISAVYVNLTPSLSGAEIELMIIISGISGAFFNSAYILPAFGGLVMSVFRDGLILPDILFCVCTACFMKKRENYPVPIIGVLVFLLKSLLSGNFDYLYILINTMVFSLVYFSVALFIRRRTKCIF